ncbi:MAG: ribosome-associated translation inhibitor RaiA [Parcubacteria group bacterium]|nr:ribosome-associated translation inhibitor RaiA [Parcubacteria group bacterium]
MDRDKNIVVKIKTTGIDLTPAIEEYTRAKIDSLQKFFKHYAEESGELLFEIEIGKTTKHHLKGDVYRAEINFNSDSAHMRSEAVKDDLYAAIDEAKDEMSRELRRSKRKALHVLRRGGGILKNIFRRS